MFSSEVLPAPFGPMTETISPRVTSSVTFSTARTPPKRFDTAVAASCGAATATLGLAAVFISIWGFPSRPMRCRYGCYDAAAGAGAQPAKWRLRLDHRRGASLDESIVIPGRRRSWFTLSAIEEIANASVSWSRAAAIAGARFPKPGMRQDKILQRSER